MKWIVCLLKGHLWTAKGKYQMPIDLEAMELEEAMWQATPRLRWYRPPHGNDNDIVLQQMYERVTGERDWRPIQTILAD